MVVRYTGKQPSSSSNKMQTIQADDVQQESSSNSARRNSTSTFADGDEKNYVQSHCFRHSLSNLCSNSSLSMPQNLTFGDTMVTIVVGSVPEYGASTSSAVSSTQVLRARHSGSDGSSKGGSSSNQSRQYPLFSGLINDARNRFPLYKSDIADGINFQCLTSLIFMFFASFAPSITFGGLMGKYTHDTMGTIETLLAQCICGVIFGLFACQPLLIMSPTGPVLIFEASLYTFCEYMELDFLTVRFYTGAWIFAIAVCTAAVDGSRLLVYVTRFTEDIFATLISAIFIAESIHFIWQTFQENPVEDYAYYMKIHTNCPNNSALNVVFNSAANASVGLLTTAITANAQLAESTHSIDYVKTLKSYPVPIMSVQLLFDSDNNTASMRNLTDLEVAALRFAIALRHANGETSGNLSAFAKIQICSDAEPNTALLTTFIMIGTFALALLFKRLRESFYFGKHIRRVIGDFSVLLAIVIVAVAVQMLVPDPYLQRLDMPDHISFTNRDQRGHGVFVVPAFNANTWMACFSALAAAFLIFILLFVETEITELLLGRRERGCHKGNGMNWDLVLMGFCAFLCSLLGLPWMCAAAVQSLAHCSSLTVMKRKILGAANEVDHVIEQRVTTVGVSLLIGAIALGGSYLRMPLASLFGVFLYLGIMNLSGVQFVQRIVLFFIPEKYFPKTPYTEQMSIWRMHFYTWIQVMCLFIVYIVKYFRRTALAFPFVLTLFIVFRHVVLPRIFTEKEIKAVDGEEEQDDTWMEKDFYENSRIPI